MSNELSESRLEEVNGGSGQRYSYNTVVHGDHIVLIAHYFKTQVQSIIDLNPIIVDRNNLITGWVLKVPDNR